MQWTQCAPTFVKVQWIQQLEVMQHLHLSSASAEQAHFHWPMKCKFRLVAGILIFKHLNFTKMKDVILSNYKNLGDSETITFGYRVVEKTENNPNFPNPPAVLGAIKKLLPEVQSAVSNAKGRDMEAVALKNNKKAELVALLTEMADYVTLTCKGDRHKLLSSGFFAAGGSTNEPDPVITQLEVELGPPGEATIKVKRLRRARAYMHQYTTEPPTSTSVWTSAGSKQPHYTFTGLNSMAKYWFRVVAISHDGQTVASPVVTRVIQ
jgi:hypothetical protein